MSHARPREGGGASDENKLGGIRHWADCRPLGRVQIQGRSQIVRHIGADGGHLSGANSAMNIETQPKQEAQSPQEREFWLAVRQSLLLMVDAVERFLNISPRTSELRRQAKG